MKTTLFLFSAALLYLFLTMPSHNEAMAQCLKTHNETTCNHILKD